MDLQVTGRLGRLLVPLLLLAPAAARADAPGPADAIAVLYSGSEPEAVRRLDCPAGRCVWHDLDDSSSGKPCGEARADVVLVTGHSAPPSYLGRDAEALARAVACFAPRLVVLDSCYAFSAPLLAALAERIPGALAIGPTQLVPLDGLDYGAAFFSAEPLSPAERGLAVAGRHGVRLERFVLDATAVAAARADVATWSRERLTANLQRVWPNYVRVPIPGTAAVLLEPVPPARFAR